MLVFFRHGCVVGVFYEVKGVGDLEIPEMRCISSEIEDMGKLECSPAIRDSEAK